MKYIIPVIAFLLMIVSCILGYGYYRQHLKLEAKNVQISEFEVRIQRLNSNIQELKEKCNSLQQEKTALSDIIAAKEKRIVQLEKFITENKLNIPKQDLAEKRNSKNILRETGSDTANDSCNPADDLEPESSSLWYWIIFTVLLVITAVVTGICKTRKKSASDVRKSKKFICPSCGWEYRTTVAECENCKTKF